MYLPEISAIFNTVISFILKYCTLAVPQNIFKRIIIDVQRTDLFNLIQFSTITFSLYHLRSLNFISVLEQILAFRFLTLGSSVGINAQNTRCLNEQRKILV